MRDRLLQYALAVSVGLHLIALGVVGRTSAARPIDLEDLKLVRVETVQSPEDVRITETRQPKPAPRPVPTPGEPKEVYIPPPEKIPVAPPARPRPDTRTRPNTSGQTGQASQTGLTHASNIPPGDPGGPLDMGSGSPNGQDLGASGSTPPGWVPGPPEGTGSGSGSGPGTGRPDPVSDATPGPGHEPAPAPPPPPPDVDVKVCTVSGMLPGPDCESTGTRSFRPGSQPGSRCTVCRPKHVSTLADRAEPELISGPKRPKYPPSALDRGIEGSVTLEYTINTEGSVTGVKVTKSSGNSDLDRAAVSAVESRKYKPAVQGGIPRSFRKRETVHFTLS